MIRAPKPGEKSPLDFLKDLPLPKGDESKGLLDTIINILTGKK